MSKQALNLEWEIIECDADWERLPAPTPVEMEPQTRRHQLLQRSLWGLAALLLIMIYVATDQAILPARGVTAQRELSVVEQVGGAAAVRRSGDQTTSSGLPEEGLGEYRSLYTAVQTTEPVDHGDSTVSTVEVGGSQGIAYIVTLSRDGAPAYRQTRFYRRIGPDWRQIAPEAALWGAERSLETPYFVYHFRQNDVAVVLAVVPQIDALYTTLQRNFGVPIMPTPEKLIIEISVTQPAGQAAPWFAVPERILVPSPAIYRAPVELTDEALLAQSIALSLPAYVLSQARERYQIGSPWQPMLDGLSLWQVWDTDLPLALWREEIVRWLYFDRAGAGSAQAVVLPKQYEALCASHALWMEAPTMLGIPLLCNELDGQAWHPGTGGSRHFPVHLDQLARPLHPEEYSFPLSMIVTRTPPHEGEAVMLATLIEYAVATYGQERLPAFVAGLGQYHSWETLIPAVYGMSAAEFEAGWQAYLVAHYGVPVRH
jgi:hypothetical protein